MSKKYHKNPANNMGSLSTVVGDEKLTSREDRIGLLFFNIYCHQNPFLKVFKVPEAKGISLNDLDEIVRCFQFCV